MFEPKRVDSFLVPYDFVIMVPQGTAAGSQLSFVPGKRLDALLASHGVQSGEIPNDGDCFMNVDLVQLWSFAQHLTMDDFRNQLANHISTHNDH